MVVLHNSRSQTYRNPYGAVPVGSAVRFCIDVLDAPHTACELRIWSNTTGETLVPMELVSENFQSTAPETQRFSATFTPDKPEILWYSFKLHTADGATWYYGAQDGRVGGEGCLRSYEGPSFQLTAYVPREVEPRWYQGGIAYQIFPDRFARGADWQERVAAAKDLHPQGPYRHVEQDWNAPVHYEKDEAGRVVRWDFYGGTLQGITERLSYLHDLGVTVLYLNPIFEAASNHRYDTGNFFEVDPFLGDDKSFKELCVRARELGISVMLDGVFNHTGCDSRYFNRYGNYDTVGAYQSEDSPYRSWFNFADDGSYSSWWGVGDLPDLNENNPSYRATMFGNDGIVRHWLRMGAAGWRLDVADELPDDFIAHISCAARQEKPDALVLGEVWEDASNKVSYGKLREYFLGTELDCVMNYNLRAPLLDFLTGRAGSELLVEALETMRENYPEFAFYQAFNMLGTHDTERVLTVLGDAPAAHTLSDEQKMNYRLNEGQLGLAKARLWLAALLQMTLPGTPSIYYGDEAGAQGYADPYNRQTFPWDHIDSDCQTIYRNAALLRRSVPAFERGRYEGLELGNSEVFGFVRTLAADTSGDASAAPTAPQAACAQVAVVVNRNVSCSQQLSIPARGRFAQDLLSGCKLDVRDGAVALELAPLGSAVVGFFDELPQGGHALTRGSGVLAHITSLPADPEHPNEQGKLGPCAKSFINWLTRAGQSYWQILPINPCDEFGSPYAGLSAFAGNPELVSSQVAKDRLQARRRDPEQEQRWQAQFAAFCKREAAWLDPYAAFCALKQLHGAGVPWQSWPQEHKGFSAALLENEGLAARIAEVKQEQFEFCLQWQELRAEAAAAGVRIVGDMPMYVSPDSADVWAHPELFDLDAQGNPRVLAGAPPDAFSAEGQVWGNPTYRWDVLAATGYSWWVARMKRAFELYDVVRLDHFLGFASYYTVPQGATGAQGSWKKGPGSALFSAVEEALGAHPLIAEDLGQVSPAARSLVLSTGAFGTEVAQFSDNFTPASWDVAPNRVAYTGTHDNETLLGYFLHQADAPRARELALQTIQTCFASEATVVIVPLQDALLLDNSARMNTPGTCDNNWNWRASASGMEEACALLHTLSTKANR